MAAQEGLAGGAADTYLKVPYVLAGTASVPEPVLPEGFGWQPAERTPDFLDVFARCLAASLDEGDRRAVQVLGAREAAVHLTGLADFSHDPGWWEVLVVAGRPRGFVLPVLFTDPVPAGPEGTVLHLGVLPEHRGTGLGRLLLRRAAQTLLRRQVHRIYCDTAAANAPMVRLFDSEGWQRGEPYLRPTLP